MIFYEKHTNYTETMLFKKHGGGSWKFHHKIKIKSNDKKERPRNNMNLVPN